MGLRVIFMGTPAFSVPMLEAIYHAGHEIVAVYTKPPQPAGRRGLDLAKSPVHQKAASLGLTILTPVTLKRADDQVQFAELNADVAVVVAYGLLLPRQVLDAPRFGCLNAHASLLPRWRGAAPIHRAIMAGDQQTGMMIMQMDEGLDTGPIALTSKVDIGPDMTTGALHDILSQTGAELMVNALARLEGGTLTTTPQSESGTTYARKIDKSEARIDWHRPAGEVHNLICGLSPFPGAWCEMMIAGKPQRVKILESLMVEGEGAAGQVLDDDLKIACASGAIRPVRLQRAGAKAMERAAFLAGNAVTSGDRVQ